MGRSKRATNQLATTLALAALWLASGLGAGVALGQSLVISEFMADNSHTITNKLGSTSDWIELYNGTGVATNLAGWHLVDNSLDLDRWTFPSTNFPAGQYLLVYASGGTGGVFYGELHTSFKLNKNADGYLALVSPAPALTVVSSYTNYPAQEQEISYGITNLSNRTGYYFTKPTPGAANNNGSVGFMADTKFSVDRGIFLTNIVVAITSATAGVKRDKGVHALGAQWAGCEDF